MTQEDKQLLLQDLCPRLPYGVMMKVSHLSHPIALDEFVLFIIKTGKEEGTPYLRPLSSMTEKENEEYNGLLFRICDFTQDASSPTPVIELTTFFYSHHLDCCGLIEKGLALEAPKDMYRYEND